MFAARLGSRILAAVAAATGLAYTALYIGRYPVILSHERLGLAPLAAGLGAAGLHRAAGYAARKRTVQKDPRTGQPGGVE